jgi:hypothetical protein
MSQYFFVKKMLHYEHMAIALDAEIGYQTHRIFWMAKFDMLAKSLISINQIKLSAIMLKLSLPDTSVLWTPIKFKISLIQTLC